MRIQYDIMVKHIFRIVDEEIDLETREGSDVFRILTTALFNYYVPQKIKKITERAEYERTKS